jgi:UDP-3-O-[3-hydroxymyristoyl] glucosamine N-acyltransferase
MKRKKNIFVITVVVAFVCCVAMTAQAAQTITIGDFEGPGELQFDGWTAIGINSVSAGDTVGAIWSSTGNGAAAITFTGGFDWSMNLADIILAQLADNSEAGTGLLVIDVHLEATDWGEDDWASMNLVALNSAIGWIQSYDVIDAVSTTFPGAWQTGNMASRTLMWDFSTLLSGYTPQDIINGDSYNGPWAQLHLSFNSSEGTSGTFYIDNIRIIVAGGDSEIDPSANISPTAVLGSSVSVAANAVVMDNASIGDDSSIGENVIVGENATLGSDTIVGAGSHIKETAIVGNDSTLGLNVTVGTNVSIGDNTFIDDNTHIKQDTSVGNQVTIGTNVNIGKNVSIGDDVTIGNDTIIQQGTIIGVGSIIGEGCIIGKNVTIGQNVSIGKNVHIKQNVVISDNTVITDGTSVMTSL